MVHTGSPRLAESRITVTIHLSDYVSDTAPRHFTAMVVDRILFGPCTGPARLSTATSSEDPASRSLTSASSHPSDEYGSPRRASNDRARPNSLAATALARTQHVESCPRPSRETTWSLPVRAALDPLRAMHWILSLLLVCFRPGLHSPDAPIMMPQYWRIRRNAGITGEYWCFLT